MASVLGRIACFAVVLLIGMGGADARTGRRHHVRRHPPPDAIEVDRSTARDLGSNLEDKSAYASGFAFGLFDAGISGTATAVSPYAPAGYGFRRPGYYGPGYGYPGY